MHAALDDELLEEGEEEGEEEVADVEAVVVGVGGDDDAAVAQALDVGLDAEGHHQVVQLLVLVDRRAAAPEHVLGLAPEAEDGLRVHVAGADHGAGRREALGEEDRGELALGVAEVVLAVLELGDAQLDLAGGLLGLLLDHVELGAELLVRGDLLLQALGRLGILAEEVVDAATSPPGGSRA